MNQIIENMESLNINATILSEGVYKVVLINGQKLMAFENGTIYRIKDNGNLKLIKNTAICSGYNLINCNRKMIKRHRILGYAFLNLNIDDVKQFIDHIDMNKINNNLNNLRIVTNQENQFNTNAKGYCFNKKAMKFQAQIQLNKKNKFLGYFTTEEEARQAYLKAKPIYHVI